ncbi:MAG: hypothetical protein ABUL72_06015, partial [Armatimonadota bacterium]
MNKKAVEVGCTNTHFVNPNGLHDPHHTTTAHDLAMLGRAALQEQRIASIVHNRDKTISRSINVGDVKLKSKNSLLDLDPSCIGMKTGWTIPACHCFVGAFVRDGMTFVTATLGSADWRNDHVALASYGAENYHPLTWVKSGDVLGEAQVHGGKSSTVSAVASSGGSILLKNGEQAPEVEVQMKELQAPVKAGAVVGRVTVKGMPGIGVDLVAKERVDAAIAPTRGNPMPWLVGSGAVGLIVARLVFRRRRRAR